MRTIPQLILIGLMAAVAAPLSARFVPATQPWLDRAGVLQPMIDAGLVPPPAPAATSGGDTARRSGGPGVPVYASELRQQPLRDVISSIGSARGVQSVELSFEVTGRLTAVRVAPGARVTAGDVIAELDAEAAQLHVSRAMLVLEDARTTVTRLDLLVQSGATTALQRQDAQLALRTAELSLQAAERDLADHRLTTPVTGYVGLIEPQVGDLITPGNAITRIEDRSSLIVDFRVPERAATMVTVGDPVQAIAISAPGKPIAGRIIAVDNRVDEASRTLRVQASIGNADDTLRAGMAFQMNLEFVGAEQPAVDPLAIQWGADGAYVWVVRAGKALRVPIRILQRNADAVIVEAEFAPGDMVVTQGVQALRPNADVAIAAARS